MPNMPKAPGRTAASVAALAAGIALVAAGTGRAAASPTQQAGRMLQAAGVRGGFIVHVGCDDGRLTAALGARDGCLVHGLGADPATVAEARAHIASKGLAGKAAVARFDGRHLPYVSNLARLVVAEDLGDVGMKEVLRVLAPGGVACVRKADGWETTLKPRPESIDEWTHYLHDATNNAVARDTAVGPPRHMQWLAGPRWTRNHHRLNSVSSVVTAGGRLFAIVDEATAAHMGVPGKWALVARDAFSGVLLWRKRLNSWAWHQIRFRSGPPQVTRLLVTDGERVYAPLGLDKPVSAVDAATGKTVATYQGTQGAEEMVLTGGTLLVLAGEPVAEQAHHHQAFQGSFRFPNRKTLVALDVETGQTRWQWSPQEAKANIRPETLASDGKRVFVQTGEAVTCLDLNSGKPRWTTGETAKRARRTLSFGTDVLVVADGVVLCKLDGTLTAISAETGRVRWERPAGGGFRAPLDVFVIDGLVWTGDHPQDSVAPPPVTDFNLAVDLQTGKVRRENQVLVDLQTSGHHHRCYREKATVRYLITGKRGIELMDLAGARHSRNNWVRGTCQYGIVPANGLLYAPPHSCGCYMESMLWGFYALAAEEPAVEDPARRVGDEERLTRGPAYGKIGNRKSETGKVVAGISNLKSQISSTPVASTGGGAIRNPKSEIRHGSSWPTYRHDPLRSGVAGTALPAELKPAWRTDVGGRTTQPVVADGLAVVAVPDAHRIVALEAGTGRVRWSHTAGGRIDSPPTLYRGLVLYGSADGRVTCLRLSDGELVWRFLAAPADLRAVAMDQVESLWPVHGSVLVLPAGGGKAVAYCAAGRSTWLDGGISLYALDPATGRVLHTARFRSEHPEFRKGKDRAKAAHRQRVAQNTTDYKTFLQSDRSDSFSMAGGAVSDVLVSNGTDVFLHHVRFSPALERQETMGRHLFSTSSLLDDTENHRSHWVLGTGDFRRIPVSYSWIVNSPRRGDPTIAVPTGVMMVFSDQAVWGVHRQGGATGRYRLFRAPTQPLSADVKPLPDFRKRQKGKKGDVRRYDWKQDLPVRPRAMLKAGERLVLGVWPIKIPDDDPHAAYEGRLGGSLWFVSAKDGTKTGEVPLKHPVVWDGLAAAEGRLYAATTSGRVVCFGAK